MGAKDLQEGLHHCIIMDQSQHQRQHQDQGLVCLEATGLNSIIITMDTISAKDKTSVGRAMTLAGRAMTSVAKDTTSGREGLALVKSLA